MKKNKASSYPSISKKVAIFYPLSILNVVNFDSWYHHLVFSNFCKDGKTCTNKLGTTLVTCKMTDFLKPDRVGLKRRTYS